MPSLIITGNPCVGKTTFAALLAERALVHKSNVVRAAVIINEESACPDRTKAQCYESSAAEKVTRAALKSEFDRRLCGGSARNVLIVLDSTNYIKGFRYELHCISKAAGERHGVVWVMADAEVAKRWNRTRRRLREVEENGDPNYFYTEETMDELARRYEPPDARNRWDNPLYRVDVTSTLPPEERGGADAGVNGKSAVGGDSTGRAAELTLQRSVYNMHSLSDAIRDPSHGPAEPTASSSHSAASTFRKPTASGFRRKKPTPEDNCAKAQGSSSSNPLENNQPRSQIENGVESNAVGEVQKKEDLIDLIDEILDSFFLNVQPLKEGTSTLPSVTADSNVLNEVDSVTQRICSSFIASQKAASIARGVGGRVVVPIGSGNNRSIELTRPVYLPEIRRLRRQYISWVANHPPDDTSEGGVANSFLSYVESQL